MECSGESIWSCRSILSFISTFLLLIPFSSVLDSDLTHATVGQIRMHENVPANRPLHR